MRLYDGTETKRNFGDFQRERSPMLIMVHEGPSSRVDAARQCIDGSVARVAESGEPGATAISRLEEVPRAIVEGFERDVADPR